MNKVIKQIANEHSADCKQAAIEQSNEWYRLNSLLGNTWARFFVIAGGRETGKSFACSEFLINQWRQKKRQFFWIRLSEISKKKLLENNCAKMFNNVLRRKYNLDTIRIGDDVYEVLKRDEKGKVIKKARMGRVMSLSEMAKDKGVELYDHEYKGWINVIVDEIVREKQEKNTFDVTYNLANQLENILRSREDKWRVIMCCNMCGDVANIFPKANFIPAEYGRYKLKKHKLIIDYLPVTEAYKKRRSGAAANLILGFDDGNFNNRIERDNMTIYQGKLHKPCAIIKFGLSKGDWFVLWDNKVIARYKGEKCKNVITMYRHLNDIFRPEARDEIIERLDARLLMYRDLVAQTVFMARVKEVKSK